LVKVHEGKHLEDDVKVEYNNYELAKLIETAIVKNEELTEQETI
jgi:hypothetical protein